MSTKTSILFCTEPFFHLYQEMIDDNYYLSTDAEKIIVPEEIALVLKQFEGKINEQFGLLEDNRN
jgi:hypothetical protein